MKRERASKAMTVTEAVLAAEYVSGVCGPIATTLKALFPNLAIAERPKLIKTVLEDMAKPFGSHHPCEIWQRVSYTPNCGENYLQRQLKNTLRISAP